MIVAGFSGVAVISPVKSPTVPVPYLGSSKKLSLKPGWLPSALGTILNSFNLPLLSVAVNLMVKSSPA